MHQISHLLAEIVIVAVPLLVAIVFHEVAHGVVAYGLGDPTAAERGRLTLNPIPHIDPFGSIILPGMLFVGALVAGTRPVLFGWAKPVPVDFSRLRHPRRDGLLVALAGPATNLLLAAVSAFVLGALPRQSMFVPLVSTMLVVNCVLAVFNLIPIPPLDGGRVLTSLLPEGAARAVARLERVGLLIVLLVLWNTGLVSILVRPVVAFFLRLAG